MPLICVENMGIAQTERRGRVYEPPEVCLRELLRVRPRDGSAPSGLADPQQYGAVESAMDPMLEGLALRVGSFVRVRA